MSSLIALDDTRNLQTKIDRKAHDLFKGKPGKAPLQVTRVFKGTANKESEEEKSCFVKNQDVWNIAQIKGLQNASEDSCQIFVVRQDRSWTTLNIQREIFERFLSVYGIFLTIWKYMFTFGRKFKENEFIFPGFSRRKTRSLGPEAHTHEIAYMLRRVEDNGREDSEDASWSIRQTAVYHKLALPSQASEQTVKECSTREKSTFLLVAPSPNSELQYNQYLENASSNNVPISPWNMHRILVSDSLRGWSGYMASLEKRLIGRSDRIVLATVGTSKENLSPLTDFIINFEDRQELKILEDSVMDLQVILPALLNTVVEVRKQCDISCDREAMTEQEQIEFDTIKDEFDEYTRELEMNVQRAKTLKGRAKSTTQLLSDLLNYEEAVAMKELTKKSQEENTSMRYLAERSTKDAAAVKILTVITLIYLPTTIVANFFSTEFVQTNDSGHMSLAKNFWLLFAIAIPLTAFTILLWWAWVHFTKVPNLSTPTPPEFQRQHSFRSIVSGKKKSQKDLESGLSAPQSPKSPPPPSFHDSAVGTWSSLATTVKSG